MSWKDVDNLTDASVPLRHACVLRLVVKVTVLAQNHSWSDSILL